jgi:mevalonate kinase
MIPHKFEEIWRKGLETNAYYLKLCGSGGGGFVLGFTQDFEQAEKMLIGHKLQVIYKIKVCHFWATKK